MERLQQNVILVIWSFNTHTQLWQWWLRAPWVLDATSSWMDSLLVSHQLPFLPPSCTSSRPPPPLRVLKSTNWATPALLPTSPLSCSSPLRVYTLKGPREPTGLTVDTLLRAHTHTAQFSSPTCYCFGFFHALHPWKSPANTKRFTRISHNIKTRQLKQKTFSTLLWCNILLWLNGSETFRMINMTLSFSDNVALPPQSMPVGVMLWLICMRFAPLFLLFL